MEKVILIRYGEIHLKGQNRPFFEKALHKNIIKALSGFPDVKVIKAQGRYYIENFSDEAGVLDALTRVFGIVSVSPAYKTEKDFDTVAHAAVKLMELYLDRQGGDGPVTFKVESRRADKSFPMDSMTLSSKLGGRLLKAHDRLTVD
ncbi:MAG TPA: THUMP domain-containing protein, partial [Candidatus Atribacteria bacterium]|nr:THUMP domain-containing protein [Candidatus Atribacteria bacterium]